MACNKCGQDAPIVEFRVKNDYGISRVSKVCTACEKDDKHARKSPPMPPRLDTSAPPPLTAMDSVRANAPRMEHVRRANDKELEQLRAEIDFLKGIHPTVGSIIEPSPKLEGKAIACMVASDWHVEEPVEKHKVHGLNEYNLEIAKARSQAFFRNGLRLTNIFADSSKIDTIYLMFGGDFISNYLHEVLREINLLGPAEAVQYAMGLLNDGIAFLLANSKYKLLIDCIPGNHGRMTKEIRSSNATETSIETFMYQSLAAFYKNEPRCEFRVANGKMLYRQFFGKYIVRFIHGDDINFGGGIGGITIPIRKKIAAWDKAVRADLTVMGHFHQFCDGGDFIVNGSLIGYNEYAQSIGASPEEARQAFFLLHERHGGSKSIVAPIWLD